MSEGTTLSALHAGDTGAETFERYRWQAKMALLSWLACLSRTGEIRSQAIVCEFLEDIVICSPESFVFAQLKTRDRGSWSDKTICSQKGALHSLCRTYAALAARSPMPQTVLLELWLEGAAASTKSTAQLFANPSSASEDVRNQLRKFGLKRDHVDVFLRALSIHPNRPPRGHIDAVILQTIGATWPALTDPERISLCHKLLAHVELAQEGKRELLRELNPSLSTCLQELCGGDINAVEGKVLPTEDLLELAPPLPTTETASIIERAARGGTSALELKLLSAGASRSIVEQAIGLRAKSEVRRQEVLATQSGEADLERLDEALLTLAKATAHQAALLGGSNPSISARPADFVFSALLSNPLGLQAIDQRRVFDGQFDLILGYLCHLSDSCRFPWRASS